jgi:hypothetical protein
VNQTTPGSVNYEFMPNTSGSLPTHIFAGTWKAQMRRAGPKPDCKLCHGTGTLAEELPISLDGAPHRAWSRCPWCC